MNLEDESLLSAFLDGELDEGQRLQVESALRSSPRLVEQLHELAAVRDLVAGLSCPALPLDLSGAFGVPYGPRRRTRPSRPVAALGLGLAAAAAVLLALTPGLRPRPRPARPPIAKASPVRAVLPTVVPEKDAPRPSLAHVETPVAPRPAAARVETAGATVRAEPAPERDRDPQRIRDLLDSPNLRRVFFVTDVIGGDAGDRVNALVQQTPRTEPVYGRIAIGPEIVIDPKHPNKAKVFALTLRDDELPRFQSRLTRAFPDAVEEAEADPVVITQLSEIGQVAVLSGPPTPDVVFPDSPARIALRDRTNPASKGPIVLDPTDLNSSDPFARARVEAMLNGTSNVQENPTPEQERSGGFPPRSLPAAEDKDKDKDAARRTSIVLVWVTTIGE